MTSVTIQQIPEEFLDWCIKSNISKLTGKDKRGDQVKLIHFAAEKGYVQVVKKLLDSGIDINCPAPNYDKETPLHYASENGKLEVAKFTVIPGVRKCAIIMKFLQTANTAKLLVLF